MKPIRILTKALCMASLILALSGCSTPKDVAYFQDITGTMVTGQSPQPSFIRVEPHDKLSIVVSSKDPELAKLFNLDVVTNRTGQGAPVNGTGTQARSYSVTSEGISSYTVSSEGTIDFPVLGELKVAGMTRQELAGFIKGELMGRELVKDPVVTVEFISTGISVLGVVGKPGRYDINTDQLTLLEGLALAGDIGIQGQRDNVFVMRRNGDTTESYRIDLTDSKSLMASPAYYLKQGDVIYVEPNNQMKRQTKTNGNNVLSASFWVSVASLLTSVALIFVK